MLFQRNEGRGEALLWRRSNFSFHPFSGRPTPSVWWYRGSMMVDDVMEAVSDESVSNTFSMQDLSREHLFMVLTCRAFTHNLTEDVTASVKLDLKCKFGYLSN